MKKNINISILCSLLICLSAQQCYSGWKTSTGILIFGIVNFMQSYHLYNVDNANKQQQSEIDRLQQQVQQLTSNFDSCCPMLGDDGEESSDGQPLFLRREPGALIDLLNQGE